MNATSIPRVQPWQALQRTLATAIRLPRPEAPAPVDPVVQSWLLRALLTPRPAP